MKKIVSVILVLAILMCLLCGCAPVPGELKEDANDTKYQILLNSGSCFVYVFEDNETGVWYVSTSEGVTPRLNADGSLYVTE